MSEHENADARKCRCQGRGSYVLAEPNPPRMVRDNEALISAGTVTTVHACSFHWRDGDLTAEDVAILSESGIRALNPLSLEQMMEAVRTLKMIPDDFGEMR